MPPQPPSSYYTQAQADDRQPLQDFHQFLRDSLIRTGNPVTSKQEEFVPFELIQQYFQSQNHLADCLYAVFSGEEHLPVDSSIVQEEYLKTFCILLSIGAGRYIRYFCGRDGLSDARLPYHRTAKPYDFPITPGQPELWDVFYKKQWVFCAAEMRYNPDYVLEIDRILPIVDRAVLGRGGSGVVSQIRLHKSYNKLRDGISTKSASPYSNTFVLKTYHEAEAEEYYYNEIDAFKRLRPLKGSMDPHIIHFYGGFIQNGTYNVILEFADKGTLEEYWQNTLPPTSGKDIEHFWIALTGVLKALIHIHEVECPNTLKGPQIFRGWHQDVKPENILVLSNGMESPYDWRFKLSDLGLSHFKKTSQGGADFDANGTETYGAPECYRADKFLDEAQLSVKQNVDIWSFGCILIEAAVWLVKGYTGLKQFRRKREEAISQIPDMNAGDWFHDGERVLSVVLQTIDELEEDFRKSDQVTGAVLEKLVKNMLDEPDIRLTAKGLHLHARRILHRRSIIETPTVSLGSMQTQPLPTITTVAVPPSVLDSHGARLTDNPTPVDSLISHQVTSIYPPTPTPISKVQPSQLAKDESSSNLPVPSRPQSERRSSTTSVTGSIRSSKRSAVAPGHPLMPTNSTSTRSQAKDSTKGPPRELPSLEVGIAERWITDKKNGRLRVLPGDYLLERLEKRDHIFVVDDAATMTAHRDEVQRILAILAYLVKDSDPDGLELYFTCSSRTFKKKEPDDLVKGFKKISPRGVTDIRIRLTAIIDKYLESFERSWLKRKFKPLRSLNVYVLTDGVWQPDNDLRPALRRLMKTLSDNGRYQVGIQFISFGSDAQALNRLNHLDDHLGLSMDIIDHERSTGNVWKMLFGSTDPWFDGGNSSKASHTTASSHPAKPYGR